MASTRKIGLNRWYVALAAQPDCELIVEVHMSREQAEDLQSEAIKDTGVSSIDLPRAVLLKLSG